MLDSALITLLTGTGVTGVFCVLFVTGLVFPRSVVSDLKEEVSELKGALEAERNRANTLAAVQFGRDLNAGHNP